MAGRFAQGSVALAFALSLASGAFAQSAAETKQVLEVVRPSWIALREYDGKDLLYFTTLVSWRCGIDKIFYRVNDGPEQRYTPEPCYTDEAVPGAIKAEDILPYVTFDPGSVEAVKLRVVLTGGEEMTAEFARADVLSR